MTLTWKHPTVIIIVMIVLNSLASVTGMYQQDFIWIDKILHAAAGVAIALYAFLILNRAFPKLESIVTVGLILGITLYVAFIWEVFEFAFWKSFPSLAHELDLYSPDILDVISDMSADILGAVVAVLGLRKQELL